jgi:hypothetical protein
MSKQSGISSLLAAIASTLVVGLVAAVSPAQSGNEEDLAAPRGAFVSTMAAPAQHGNIVYVAQNGPALLVTASEEDAAVPQGSFTSTMIAPRIRGNAIKLASDGSDHGSAISLSEIVAASLE